MYQFVLIICCPKVSSFDIVKSVIFMKSQCHLSFSSVVRLRGVKGFANLLVKAV